MNYLERYRTDRARDRLIIDSIPKLGRRSIEADSNEPLRDVTAELLARKTAHMKLIDERIAEEERDLHR